MAMIIVIVETEENWTSRLSFEILVTAFLILTPNEGGYRVLKSRELATTQLTKEEAERYIIEVVQRRFP